jgi:hypothetical protein
MIAGAWLWARRPLGARIMASVGTGLLVVTAAAALAFEGPSADESMIAVAVAYLLLHVAVGIWIWRSRRGAAL